MQNLTVYAALAVLLIVVTLCALWWYGPRLFHTLFLITRVTPYERQIDGAPRILILGDSTGYGTGAQHNRESVAGRIGADFSNYTILNNSANGRTVNDLVSVTKDVDGAYELILLQIGGNDILQHRPVATVEAELRDIVATLTNHTEHLVLMSTGNVGGATVFTPTEAERYAQLSRTYRDMFFAVASTTPLTYIDLFEEPENDPFIQDPSTYLASDGLHPSGAGYGLWYNNLKPVLTALLTDERMLQEYDAM